MGNQKYQNLVLETNDDRETTIEFNVSQEELSSKYTGLEQQMTNTLSNLMGKVFKGITGTKVLIPQKFTAARGGFSIRCTVKANDGLLYPMAKSFIFIHKPTLIIKFDDIASVEFERYTPNANAGKFRKEVPRDENDGDGINRSMFYCCVLMCLCSDEKL